MAQDRTTVSQVQADVEPGMWCMFDRSRRIAIIRLVKVRGHRRYGWPVSPFVRFCSVVGQAIVVVMGAAVTVTALVLIVPAIATR